MKKAADFVCEGKDAVQSAVGCLEQAINHAEKQKNKQALQDAICALNNACDDLSKYRD